MILNNEQLNKLHILFQNVIVSSSADDSIDFDFNLVALIIPLVVIYIERQTSAYRPR